MGSFFEVLPAFYFTVHLKYSLDHFKYHRRYFEICSDRDPQTFAGSEVGQLRERRVRLKAEERQFGVGMCTRVAGAGALGAPQRHCVFRHNNSVER